MEIQETRDEIIRRSNKHRVKREKRTVRILECCCVALLLPLTGIIQQVASRHSVEMADGQYATLMLGSDGEAYVLIGFICFVLGVLVTLIITKSKMIKRNEKGDGYEA